MTSTAAAHAPSLQNTSCPLCGAREFTRVTMCLENVTCENCILILNAGGTQGAPVAGRGLTLS